MVLVQSLRKFGIREKSETKVFKEDRDVVDISDDADDVIGLNYRLLIRFNHPERICSPHNTKKMLIP